MKKFPIQSWSSRLIIAAFLLSLNALFPASARAWFQVCNGTGERLRVAFAYAEPLDHFFQEPNWESRGWWNLAQGQCVQLYPYDLLTKNNYYYVYAESDTGGIWSGRQRFGTKDEPFYLTDALNLCQPENPGESWRRFIQVYTGSARNYTYHFKN